MSIAPEHLVVRTPILDRNQDIAFHRLEMAGAEADVILPLMLHLSNVEAPLATCFIPIAWLTDEVLLDKLTRNAVLVVGADVQQHQPLLALAADAGYRIARAEDCAENSEVNAEFRLVRFDSDLRQLTPDCILTRLASTQDFRQTASSAAMYCSGSIAMLPPPAANSKHSNPAHGVILELMSAVQNEASPKDIEVIFKRDVTLSFKLLRYINSPWFGLATRVESVRHALSILGYQQLLKWLALLAVTAGQASPPAITQTAMIRARLLELVASKKLERREADNLFLTGMLSLLDRIMGMPLPEILARANLPPAIVETLTQGEGKYQRFLDLALACEGSLSDDAMPNLPEVDVRMVNIAHMEAIEWAARITGTRLA